MATNSYTYTTTPAEEDTLTLIVASLKATNPASTATNSSVFLAEIQAWIRGQCLTYQTQLLGNAIAAYEAATVSVQQQVLALLGLPDITGVPIASQLAVLQVLGPPAFLGLSIENETALYNLLGI